LKAQQLLKIQLAHFTKTPTKTAESNRYFNCYVSENVLELSLADEVSGDH